MAGCVVLMLTHYFLWEYHFFLGTQLEHKTRAGYVVHTDIHQKVGGTEGGFTTKVNIIPTTKHMSSLENVAANLSPL